MDFRSIASTLILTASLPLLGADKLGQGIYLGRNIDSKTFKEYATGKLAARKQLALAKASAKDAVVVGKAKVDGNEKTVYYSESLRSKYFIEGDRMIDLTQYRQQIGAARRAKYGRLSKSLFEKLEGKGSEFPIEVIIEFKRLSEAGKEPGNKMGFQQNLDNLDRSYHEGLAKLSQALPIDTPAFSGQKNIRLKLTNSQIQRIKYSDYIEFISPAIMDPVKTISTAGWEPLFESYTDGGMEYNTSGGICENGGNQSCGDGIEVGIVESGGITAGNVSSYLNGAWFNNRGGTPYNGTSTHGLFTSSIIRNSAGSGDYGNGGSDEATVNFATSISGESGHMGNADAWVRGQGSNVISNSWSYSRWIGGASEDAQFSLERTQDVATVSYPYPIYVNAAGNYDQTGVGTPNQTDCVDESATAGVYWSATDCRRVVWWNYNSLVVGGVSDHDSKASFSNYLEGDGFNEAPQVASRATSIPVPFGSFGSISGTSFSTPSVASLAANIMDKHGLAGYPDAVKATILASSVSTGNEVDAYGFGTQIGAGIPNSKIADLIAGYKIDFTSIGSGSGNYGLVSGYFFSSDNNGATQAKTVTIPNANGKKIHFYLVFLGNYSDATPGSIYYPDDVDLKVTSGVDTWSSTSGSNTVEYIGGFTQGTASRSYDIEVKLYARGPDSPSGSDIYFTVAWAIQ